MASNFEEVKDEKIKEEKLICSHCSELFKNPKVLPCLHSFCEGCLQKMITENGGTLICPTCSLEVPDNNVSALPTNYLLTGNADYVATVKELGREDTLQCGECKNGVAVTRCIDCSQVLCEVCTGTHRGVEKTEGHQIRKLHDYTCVINEMKVREATVHCDKHEQLAVEVYCETCKIPVCMRCALVEHPPPRHRHRDMTDAAEEGKLHLQPVIQKLKGVIKTTADAKTNIELELKKLNDCRDNTEKSISLHMKAIFERLVKKEFECLHSFNSVEDRAKHVLSAEIELKPRDNSDIWFIENDAIADGDIGIVSQHSTSEVKVEGLPKLVNLGIKITITIKSATKNLVLRQQDIGVEILTPSKKEKFPLVSMSDDYIQSSISFEEEGEYSLTVTHWNKKVQDAPLKITAIPPVGTVHCFGSKGCYPSYFDGIRGIAINHNDYLAVADSNNHRVQILDWAGRCLKCLTFDQFPKPFMPYDVAVSSIGLYFIADAGNNQIVVCTEENEIIITFGQTQMIQPIGIKLTNDGHVLVTDQQPGKHCIRKYTVDGIHVAVTQSTGSKAGKFKEPHSIVTNKNNQILVSDKSNNRIQVFDSNFKYVSCFQSQGSHDHDVKYPHGISIDNEDNIYVCDPCNKKICKYSPEFEFLGLIAKGEWESPNYITVSKDYPLRMVVSETAMNQIKILYLQSLQQT
ncbi:E3 ubiquitin-protein ligase TRIM71-like [Saccoglossus kowalevskii]